ncbi:MAG TPA: hypothetical protein VJB99_02895 [Patescibacteria group bacterium]|nr:hypothetical protein [Patescibacteria group bacterium]
MPPLQDRLKALLILQILAVVVWTAGIVFFHLPSTFFERSIPSSVASIPALARLAPEFILVAVGLFFLLSFFRKRRTTALAVSILLGALVLQALSLFLDPWPSFFFAIVLIYLERAYPSFLTRDFLILSAVFAGAIPFAVSFSPLFLLFALGIFSVWDFFLVSIVPNIPGLAVGVLRVGTTLPLFAPKPSFRWWNRPCQESVAASLGAGDVFLPLLFLLSVSVRSGLRPAFVCLVGALVGSGFTLLLTEKRKGNVATLPFLTAGLAAGYVLFFFFGP